MREGGFGTKVSLDGRMIWDVGGDDEGAYVFADDSIKSFISQHYLSKQRVEEVIESLKEKEGVLPSSVTWNAALNTLRATLLE